MDPLPTVAKCPLMVSWRFAVVSKLRGLLVLRVFVFEGSAVARLVRVMVSSQREYRGSCCILCILQLER